MSIEMAGPRGFEYQYLITLEMALQLLEFEDVRVYVENDCFEDANLLYHDESQEIEIDLQVKHKEDGVSFEEFCGWLAHFKKRSSDLCILEKLQNNEGNYLVFVTNNRCTDLVSRFLWDGKNIEDSKTTFSKSYLDELKKTILDRMEASEGISQKRLMHMKEYFSGISDTELKKVLKKVKFIERETEQEVTDKICKLLKMKYYIPESECQNILRRMIDCVQDGRDSGDDIVEGIRNIIKENRGHRILPYDEQYYKRDKFKVLQEHLANKNVLLLTGVPFSGKTYLAKALAQNLQEEGYFIKSSESLIEDNEAYHFLRAPENDQRLLMLEDPFGQNRLKENAQDNWDKILTLIREWVASNRKLIITTRKDILFEVCKRSTLQQCKIFEHTWWDTAVDNLKEMEEFWKRCYGESKESFEVLNRICAYLEINGRSTFLEIGEIRHLYRENASIQELQNVPVQEIVNMARISVDEICRKVSSHSEEFRENFILLGCFCDTIRSISEKDLAYILCGTEEEVSIRQNTDSVVVSADDEDVLEEEFPIYKEKAKLNASVKNVLRELCKKGYLYRDSISKEIMFSHPLYLYASRKMLAEEVKEGWDTESILNYLKRGLGSLSRNAAICSLESLQQNFKGEESIASLFCTGSNSIFPSVRDRAILYLDQNFEKLDESIQNEFIKNIKDYRIADNYIKWKDDECWYQKSNSYHQNFGDFRDIWGPEVDFTIGKIKDRLKTDGQFLKKEIYDILQSKLGDELPLEFLEYALLCDEAVIRSKAMYFIFAFHGEELSSIKTKYLSQIENHNVVYSMLRGVLNNWKAFGDNDRDNFIQYFQNQFDRKSVAFYIKGLFETFGDEYKREGINWISFSEKEKKELWELWAVLFSKWLKCFPAKYMWMDESHMSETTMKSLEYLANQKEIMEVGNSWIQWLKKYSKYRRPNDYGMSVLEYILQGTEEESILRSGVIEQLLDEKNTNIITTYMANLVREWDILNENEKNYICQFLTKTKRKDIKWIQAIMLVQQEVPFEIQELICGEVFFNKPPKEILEILEKNEILEECLSIFCGFPQPLWRNGYHHRGPYKLWDGVMIEVLNRGKIDECYYIALHEFIDALYNEEPGRFEGGYNIYKELIQKSTNRTEIYERLAYCLMQNQDNKNMWDDLLNESTEEEKIKFFEKLSRFVMVVEKSNAADGGLLAEFDYLELKQFLLPYFPEDQDIIMTSWMIREVCHDISQNQFIDKDDKKIEKLRTQYLEFIKAVFTRDSPKLLLTSEIVKIFAQELGCKSDEINSILVENKEGFWERCDLQEKNFEENCPLNINDKYQLKNWCDQ